MAERRPNDPYVTMIIAVLVYAAVSWLIMGPDRPLPDYVFCLVWSVVLSVVTCRVFVRLGWL